MLDDSVEMDELYAWIDTIPLSRPKKNISRDFADGVLLAEVIHHFLPKYVDLHNYPSASSAAQRKINWQTLNRRVLVKIGIRISDETVQFLMDSKPGVIEQVLQEVRSKIDSVRFGKVQYHRSKSHGPAHRPCRGESRTKMSVIRVDAEDSRRSGQSSPKVKDFGEKELEPNYNNTSGSMSPVYFLPLDCSSYNKEPSPPEELSRNRVGDCPNEKVGGLESTIFGHKNNGQGYVAPPPGKSLSKASLRSSTRSLKSSTSDRFDDAAPPHQIIYRGHKMVPLQLLDEREKEMKQLESTNRSLTIKIFRLETLVNIKDQRVEDLTHQLRNLRAKYEHVTNSTLAAAGVKGPVGPRADDVVM